MKSASSRACVSGFMGLCLMAATAAHAQISTINSAVITPRVFNDFPGATGNYVNNYPTSITLGESGVFRATSGGLDRDFWQFSNNGGSSAYTFGGFDYFTVSMDVTLSGTTLVDNEAGFIIPNSNGTFPGGDLQFLANANGGFLGMFGGTGYWNSGLTYTAGETVTLGMQYFYDSANSANAFQFWVNAGTGNIYSPVQDWTGSLAGDNVGGYYQIGNDGVNTVSGQAVFGNISITQVPEPSLLAFFGLGALPMMRLFRRRA